MPEEKPATDQAAKNDHSQDTGDTGGIPKSRFDEVIGERNDLRKKLDELTAKVSSFQKTEEERAQAKAIEEGKQSEVISDLQKKLAEAQGFVDTALKERAARLDSLRTQLPEDKQEKYAGINDVTLLENLVNDFKITGGGTPGDRPAVPKEEMGGYKSWLEYANKDPKGYAKQFQHDSAQSIVVGVSPE